MIEAFICATPEKYYEGWCLQCLWEYNKSDNCDEVCWRAYQDIWEENE